MTVVSAFHIKLQSREHGYFLRLSLVNTIFIANHEAVPRECRYFNERLCRLFCPIAVHTFGTFPVKGAFLLTQAGGSFGSCR